MLPSVTRWKSYIIILLCFLLIVHICYNDFSADYIPHRSSSWCPDTPPNILYSPPAHDRFKWRDIPTKYPAESLTSIPKRPQRRLPAVQHTFRSESGHAKTERKARQSEVKRVFLRCWNSYKKRAWLRDELAPISGGAKDTFGGWGATLVDSLDTLWIMDLKEEFNIAVSSAVNIDFGPENSTLGVLNIFETTIRHLGGFLSAYDMTGCKDKRLLDKALELGDMIYASFDTPNRMPIARWSPREAANGKEQLASDGGILAELASSSLEFTRLSQLTGDMRFYDAIARITDLLESQQNLTKLAGMWPVAVDMRNSNITKDSSFSLGAMSDSAYEYLPKMFALLGGGSKQASQYRKMYEQAMNTAMQRLLFRPMVPGGADILMAGIAHAENPTSPRLEPTGQHLACFAGGMLSLGGRLIGNTTHVETGRKLTDGCIWAYKNSINGIMPEWFKMSACSSLQSCEWNEALWQAQAQAGVPFGFTEISDRRYILRPEAIESVFILYRITGNAMYQTVAWDMFQAIVNTTTTEFGNAAIRDVTQLDYAKEDSMESFWMAETLKYFYLIFSEPQLISLDEFVFNTEAHPFRLYR